MISRFPAPLPSPAAPSGAPHMVPPPLPPGASPPVPPPPIAHEVPRPDRPSVNHCRRSGCSSPVPLSSPVGFCQTHCTSSRCSLHSTPTRRRRCRARGFFGSTFLCQWVLRVSLHHCTHTQCGPIGGGSQSTLRVCRIPSCSERVHPECSSRCCTLHCTSSRCAFHGHPNGVVTGEATHDGSPILFVGVCCIQETNAGDFTHSLWINRTHMMDLVGPEDGRQRS